MNFSMTNTFMEEGVCLQDVDIIWGIIKTKFLTQLFLKKGKCRVSYSFFSMQNSSFQHICFIKALQLLTAFLTTCHSYFTVKINAYNLHHIKTRFFVWEIAENCSVFLLLQPLGRFITDAQKLPLDSNHQAERPFCFVYSVSNLWCLLLE